MTTSSLITLTFFLLFVSHATCFNITRILDQFPDFQTFNNYLNLTLLNLDINSRSTITVLVVDNGAMGSIGVSDPGRLKRIMSLHVLLDYYDKDKLQEIPKKGSDVPGGGGRDVTTLFQSTGEAIKYQGFVKITREQGGGFMIGSSENGTQPNARFVKQVFIQPYNISVMQISNPIYVPGVQDNSQSTPRSPPPPAAKAPAPQGSSDKKKSPKAAPSEAPAADAPEADAPDAETPDAKSPAADAPDADAPDADRAPASGPSPSPDADAPDADSPDGSKEKAADSSSTVARVRVGSCFAAVVVAVSSWAML